MGATGIFTKRSFEEVLKDEMNRDGYLILDSHYVKEEPLNGELEEGHFYTAVKHPAGHVFGCVVTMVRVKRPGNHQVNEEVIYRLIDESMGPIKSQCPKRILDKLSPLDKLPYVGYSKEWRERCATYLHAQEAKEKYNTTMHKLSS